MKMKIRIYHNPTKRIEKDETYETSYRKISGGSWTHVTKDAKVSDLASIDPRLIGLGIGFRIARRSK